MAIAERRLAAEFNRDGHDDRRPLDLRHRVATATSRRASRPRRRRSPATSGCGKLVVLYDDNHIQLDGPTAMAWSEDVPQRFEAYGWHTQRVDDGNDVEAIEAAIMRPRDDDRPSLIAVRTHIGFGSPNKQDSQKAHGPPLGPDEVRLTKEAYGWDPGSDVLRPGRRARAYFRAAVEAGEELVADWERADGAPTQTRIRDLGRRVPAAARRPSCAEGWDAGLKTYEVGDEVATRNASQDAIQALADAVPELFGGAADLSESNLTDVKGEPHFSADEPGRNLRFGVREHAMGGIAERHRLPRRVHPVRRDVPDVQRLHARRRCGWRRWPACHVIHVWTHDSVGPGRGRSDPPAGRALRGPPGDPEPVVRPAGRCQRDGGGVGAGRRAAGRPGRAGAHPPEAADPARARPRRRARASRRGGYVLRDADGRQRRDLILIGTGSELQLAFAAAEALEADGIPTRVVSLPCWEPFDAQDQAYRDSVLPPAVRKRVSVEIGVSLGWERWVGDEGAIIGLDHFGASAPAGTIFEHFGFTADRVADVARRVVRDGLRGRIADRGRRALRPHGRRPHPTLRSGESGVDRTEDSDPGHS